jgi:hypothetical protein
MRVPSLAFGLLMVAAGTVQSGGVALAVSVVALAAVLLGLVVRMAATVAVMATGVTLALSGPSPVVAAIAGLSATVYLLLRHARRADALTMPTMLGALGLSGIAILGAVIPLTLPWVPLVAPLAAVAAYVVVVDRYVGDLGAERPLR